VSALLERLSSPAGDLMRRVDLVLSQVGAPGDHPVWPMVRRLGALPGAAFECLLGTPPQPLADAAEEIVALGPAGLADELAAAGRDVEWSGPAYEAFAAQFAADIEHLRAMGRGAAATARYAADVADWWDRARRDLALTLVATLASTEAVRLRCCAAIAGSVLAGDVPREVVLAAADIGYLVLESVSASCDDAVALSTEGLAEVPYRPADGADPGGQTFRVAL